jgi:hypothetical protein
LLARCFLFHLRMLIEVGNCCPHLARPRRVESIFHQAFFYYFVNRRSPGRRDRDQDYNRGRERDHGGGQSMQRGGGPAGFGGQGGGGPAGFPQQPFFDPAFLAHMQEMYSALALVLALAIALARPLFALFLRFCTGSILAFALFLRSLFFSLLVS